MPLRRLEGVCGQDDAMWLHRLSRGIDDEEVKFLIFILGFYCLVFP